MQESKTAILLIDCPDRKGIVAAIINFLVQNYDVNILNADQHQDTELGLFFMRVEFSTEAPEFSEAAFRNAFEPVAQRWFVSRHGLRPEALCAVLPRSAQP